MDELLAYGLRIMPGLILLGVTYVLLPKRSILARIFMLLLGFVLMRDAMTPIGLWNFGLTETTLWIRFIDDSFVLVVLGVLSLIVAGILLRAESLKKLVRWGNLKSWKTYVVGLLGGLAVALPFVLLSLLVPIEDRGGLVATSLLPALFFMAFAGNFLEELIFRGFFQSYFEAKVSMARAAVLSGLMFAAAHVFLASTVTNLGWPLLVFVVIEGLACAFVYRKYGLISSTIVHGSVIFIMAAGII